MALTMGQYNVSAIFGGKLARRRAARVLAGLSTIVLAGCGETGINELLEAARVEAVSSTAPSGPAGAQLPTPVAVRVLGSDNQPLPGVTVTFSAAQGGTVSPASAVTNEDGLASTRWTLGNTAGQNVLTARVSASVSTTIIATGTAARAASVALVAGNNQTGPASAAVPISPSVRVVDAFNNLVAGVTVSFTVLSGSGQATGSLVTTNAQGIATVGSWILGPAAGTQTLSARVEESGVANNPIVFTATATAPTGAQMVIIAGNNQQAPVNQLVPIAPRVAVRNGAGLGVPGVVVTFTVATGGGSVVGSQQTTDANGLATAGGWFMGPLPGENTLTATAPGLTVTFTATGTAGVPVS
ncbi:MAG: Ig-like domain-containing protein, partial [Longimicrobiales bacterium]